MSACAYCGGDGEHRDHIIPRSRGGGDDARNCVVACGPCNLNKSDRTPSEWRPTGLPGWIYDVEEKLANKYKMKARTKRRRLRSRGAWCYFCGAAVERAEDGAIEIVDQELPPLAKPGGVRFRPNGGREEYGRMTYPGNGTEVFARLWTVSFVSHYGCGPGAGYWIALDRIGEDWAEHLRLKRWYPMHLQQFLEDVRGLYS